MKKKKTREATLILFVCAGNICRSPLAQGYLRKRIKEEHIPGVRVESAGILGIEGKPASEGAAMIARSNDFHIEDHVSQSLTPDLIERSKLVIVMEDYQKDYVLQTYPESKNKIFLLQEFSRLAPSTLPVIDPYGRDPETYRLSFEQIREGVEGLIDHLTSTTGPIAP